MAATADKISEEQKKAISKNWTYIQGNLDAKDILPHLIQGGFMKPSDRETIISYNPDTPHNRNCAFFSWLFDSPRGAYDAFMSALHINHGWVEEKIRNTDVDENDVIIDPMRQFAGAVKESDKLKKLLDKSLLEIEEWEKKDGLVFVETPAFQECRMKLKSKGCVTILGQSGDGKTSVGFRLLAESSRQVIIIRKASDWEEIDVKKDPIIMIDDIMGRHVFDKNAKVEWVKILQSIDSSVKSGKVQIVITSRGTVFSVCKEELQAYDLFHLNNIVHLSGSESRSNLNIVTKIEILRKNINFAEPKIYICETENESVAGVERKISESTLKMIAEKKTVLGFPQCCHVFVSTPAFNLGHYFFDNPTKFLITEIDRMRTSDDTIDQFNYCTLVCVLFYEELTDDTIEKQLETIKVIVKSCKINASSEMLQVEIKDAAVRLSTSYLVWTRDKGFTFQHNSLLETIFTSFFQSEPKLLIKHCAFNLIQSLVTTEQATDKFDLFCKIQGGKQTDCLCSRLATEIMSSNVIQAVGHRTLTDPVFVSKFFSHINTSSNKTTVLQSTQYNESILYWAARVSDKCFVEKLLTELESIMSVDTMEEEMSRALCEACFYGNYGVFTLLMSRPGVKVFDDCLRWAAYGGHDRIVTDLLSVRKWSTHHVTQALYKACSEGRYDVYRLLITHNVTAIDGDCLWCAAEGGDDRIVTDLFERKWSTSDITQALYKACREGRYDMYRLLITHNVTAIDDDWLCKAAEGGDDCIVTDLLSIRKWSTRDVTQALYKACIRGRYDVYRLLITHSVTDIDVGCLVCAAEGGDDRIVTNLLSVRKWSTRDVTQALYQACLYGRYDTYRSLITHNVTAIDGDCLWWAASGGHDRIVTDLLSVRKWSTHDVTRALYQACSEGRYDTYRSLITHNVTAIDDDRLCEAASGGHDRIVTDLLSVRKWSTRDVTQALYQACSKGRYDTYRLLITHNVTAIDGGCLCEAAIGGHDRIVTDLLSVRKWSTHDITQALYSTCRWGSYDVYRLLIKHNVTAIDGDCLCEAAIGGHDRIVTDLLSVRKWSTHDITQALYSACRWGSYDVYRLLIKHNVTAIDGDCLCEAAIGGHDRIVTDLLSVRKWSTHDVTQALYQGCSEGRYDVYSSLITHNVTAIDVGCLWRAAYGGHDRIVTDLLSVRKWSKRDVTQALYEACSEGRYDVYRLLITHNVTAIDGGCLWRAVSAGHDRIVTDLLSVRKWSTHDVTQALYYACSKGRYDVYRLLITHNVTVIDDGCLWRAAYGGHDRIVTDLLSVRKWSTHDVTQALYKACLRGRYDMYSSLITHNVTAIDGGCLWMAVRGGNTKIKDDLLSKGYKLSDS